MTARLAHLLKLRLARFELVETGGRPAERWFTVSPRREYVKRVKSPSPVAADAGAGWEVFGL